MNKNTKKNVLNIFQARKLNILFIGVIVMMLFTYIYSYQVSVTFASSIESFEDKISNMESEISELEVQLVENKRGVSKSIATEKGFVALEDVVFIKRNSETALNAISN